MAVNKWTEEETILAYYYYCQIPFGKIHQNNPEIIRIANMIGRSPSAVVFKMGNLAHFDPEQQKRNVNGLSNASHLDKEIVQRFFEDWESLTYQAKEIEARFGNDEPDTVEPEEELIIPAGEDREQTVRARVNQRFFRNAVLTAYGGKCCITGISQPKLLIASHIKPWAKSDPKTERTNPSNGLCLNALHDRAFDQGLITISPDLTIRVSSTIKDADDEGSKWIASFQGKTIVMPNKFIPKKEFLEYHNDVIFNG